MKGLDYGIEVSCFMDPPRGQLPLVGEARLFYGREVIGVDRRSCLWILSFDEVSKLLKRQ